MPNRQKQNRTRITVVVIMVFKRSHQNHDAHTEVLPGRTAHIPTCELWINENINHVLRPHIPEQTYIQNYRWILIHGFGPPVCIWMEHNCTLCHSRNHLAAHISRSSVATQKQHMHCILIVLCARVKFTHDDDRRWPHRHSPFSLSLNRYSDIVNSLHQNRLA